MKKLNLAREVMWSYFGEEIDRSGNGIKLEARFNRETSDAGYVVFERNDRLVEYFYADRWYNIFEIHSVWDDHLKGWYCNIAEPAVFLEEAIEQVDLALDVWISPDGTTLILDEDEFTELMLDDETRQQAHRAVQELIALVQQRNTPFDSIK
ncbi:MAG TPA: DUF402 domain-containing protein [Anaerolineae bacterium]|nr:DUF402 domain-containing protein [Anaerolineae bacterium]